MIDTGDLQLLDLDAFLARIGFTAQPARTVETLADLHLAHATQIAFENLDVFLGRPIRIDLPAIQEKIVFGKRGGYCFEQNRLFATVLAKLGFAVTFLAARVRYRANRVLPRTHVLLLVEVNGSPWLADVGFGTVGLLRPIPLIANKPVEQFAWSYRLIEEPGLYVLQTLHASEWQSLYAFSLEPQFIPDLEMGNYFVSTHPTSLFAKTLVVQRSTLRERFLLRNWELTVDQGQRTTTKTLRNHDELIGVLTTHFDLHLPAGTQLRIPNDRVDDNVSHPLSSLGSPT
jgi:N-hydroxyarylamine O-acetyltransferase